MAAATGNASHDMAGPSVVRPAQRNALTAIERRVVARTPHGFTGALTARGRLVAAPVGQHRLLAPPPPALRGRDLSGIRSRANSPIPYARQLLALREPVPTVPPPVWAAGPTAAALHQFDGYILDPPFHLVVRRSRNVARIGRVVHAGRDIEPLDTVRVEGIASTSATRTIIDLAASPPRSHGSVWSRASTARFGTV